MIATDGLVILWLSERLVSGSLQAIVLVPLVWLVTRAKCRLPAAVQAWLWWIVALKLLLAFVPLPAVRVPVLPASTPVSAPLVATDGPVTAGAAPPELVASEPGLNSHAAMSWRGVTIGLWLTVVLVHAGRLLTAYRRARRLISSSTPVDDADLELLASQCGLNSAPDVRSSPDVDTPQVIGVRHPMVLLPETLAGDDRRVALAHEFMHVRRDDVACGWIPALAERLFFFHPLVRFVTREYLTAREAACDGAVVRALVLEPADYGRLLIRFGVTRNRTAFAAGGASASAASLRRRLNMLQHSSTPGSRWFVLVVCAAIATTLVPIHLVAQANSAPQLAVAPLLADPSPSPPPAPAPAPAAAPATQATPLPAPRPNRAAVPVAPAPRHAQVPAGPPQPSQETAEFLKERLAEAQRAFDAARAQQLAATQQRELEELNQRDALAAREIAVEAAKQALADRLASTEKLRAEFDIQGTEIRKQVEVLQKQLEQMADRIRELERALQLQAPGTAPAAR